MLLIDGFFYRGQSFIGDHYQSKVYIIRNVYDGVSIIRVPIIGLSIIGDIYYRECLL